MIWQVAVKLHEVFAQGRSYPWARPKGCLRCGRCGVWGHGFVGRYFDGFDRQVLLRCYRCPGCGCVMTPRPAGYFRRIRCSIAAIRQQLDHRVESGRWLGSPASPARGRHWLAHLKRHTLSLLTYTWGKGLLAAFDRLLETGFVPVGRTIQTDNRIASYPPQ
jgi:hypothetical protein